MSELAMPDICGHWPIATNIRGPAADQLSLEYQGSRQISPIGRVTFAFLKHGGSVRVGGRGREMGGGVGTTMKQRGMRGGGGEEGGGGG